MLNAAEHVFMLVLAHVEYTYGSDTDRLSSGHEGSPSTSTTYPPIIHYRCLPTFLR